MNVNLLYGNLIRAARKHPVSDAVPYRFEQRVLARIQALARPDPLAIWGKIFWRAALSSLAVMVLISAWTLLPPSPSTDLSDEIEVTVLAGLNEMHDNW